MLSLHDVRRIVFLRTDRLGETLLNLPTVAALKAAFPDAALTLVVHSDLCDLLTAARGVDRVLPHREGEGRWWVTRARRLARTLRTHRFDLAVVSNPKKELHVAVWSAGIPLRAGYARKWGRWLLTHRVDDRKALGERHEVEYNLDLVRALGLPTTVPPWSWPCLEREQQEVFQLLELQGVSRSRPLIAVHPWTSNPVKEWPAQRYRLLLERINERLPVQAVLIGGAESPQRIQDVLPAHGSVANLVGRLSLVQLAALLQRVRILVSNDSGPVHLAAAVGTRTLVLFGAPSAATGPTRWGPWGTGHTVIWKASMEEIAVEEVFEVLQRQIA